MGKAIDAEVLPEPRLPRYQGPREIGRGGMGVVWEVVDQQFDRMLALKTLLPDRRRDAQAIARFEREAQLSGSLQHPAIPPVVDRGKLDDGSPFFSMKLVEGETLAAILERRRSTEEELPRLLGIFEQICQAVGYAHARNIIHRDLKPSNIMVGEFGEVQVMDWGLAKKVDEPEPISSEQSTVAFTLDEMFPAQSTLNGALSETNGQLPGSAEQITLTRAGEILGTLAYIPPEQAKAEVSAVTARSDVFALGGILCKILTGQAPYEGTSARALFERAVSGDLNRPLSLLEASTADRELISLCKRCLSKEPNERPADASEIAREVRHYQETLQKRLEQEKLERAAFEAKAVEEKKRRKLVVVTMALAMLLLVTIFAVGLRYSQLRSAEQIEQVAEITEARSRAETIREQIQAVTPATLAQWQHAEDQWQAAEEILGDLQKKRLDRVRHTDEFQQLAKLYEEVRERAAAVRKDRRMFERLEIAFEKRGDIKDSDYNLVKSNIVTFGHSGAEDYAEAFREYGVDVLKAEPASASDELGKSAIRSRISEALTDWIVLWYDRPEANRLLSIAQRIDPDPDRSKFREALVRKDGDQLTALAQAMDPKSAPPTTILPLADGLNQLGKYEGAIHLLESALTYRPNDFWYNDVLGALLLMARPERIDDGIMHFRVAMSLRPEAHFVYSNLAAALALDGKWQRAEDVCRRGLQIRPGDVRIQTALAELFMLQSRFDEAEKILQDCLKQSPDSLTAMSTLAALKNAVNKPEEALKISDDILKRAPEHALALNSKSYATIKIGDLDATRRIGEHLRTTYPHHSFGYEALIYVEMFNNRPDEAERIANEGLRQCAGDSGIHSLMFYVLNRKGQTDAALGHLRKAAAMMPGLPSLHRDLGTALEEQKSPALAEEVYLEMLIRNPRDAHARTRLKAVLLETGHRAQAEIRLEDAIKELPEKEQESWRTYWSEITEALKQKAQTENEDPQVFRSGDPGGGCGGAGIS